MRLRIAAAILLALSAGQAAAEGLHLLGTGRLAVNDVYVGPYDRWQTGSLSMSLAFGQRWNGTLPDRPGELLELRMMGQVVAPDNLVTPDPRDRPYANALSFGMHTHFAWQGMEVAAGADLVATGDQTGLHTIQSALHDVIGVPGVSEATRAAGIGKGSHPTVVAEAGRDFAFGAAHLRPFVEGRYGIETLVRAGVDLTIGTAADGKLLVRDPVSGHRYRVIGGRDPGISFVLGADYAHVTDSVFLPQPAHTLEDRLRLRAGLHLEHRRGRIFYGVAWLSPEFAAQPQGQLVGALRLDYDF